MREPRPNKDPNQKRDPEPCGFFLWEDEQDEAKEWTQLNPTTPVKQPQRQPREIRTPNNGSSKKMKEWLSTGKKRAIKDISDEDNEKDKEDKEDGDSNEEFAFVEDADDDVFYQDNTRNGSPSRKSAKVTRFATPGQPSNRMLGDGLHALPTPATSGRDVESVHESRQLKAREVTPTPVQLDAAIVLGREDIDQPGEKTDLLKTILGYIKADYPDLKYSTEVMIQHEIEGEARMTRAEAKGYRKTISRLREKADECEKKAGELEKIVSNLTGGCGVDDVVELSD